jgi:hypothetical protein
MSARDNWANAEECFGWARSARSNREREIFVQMANAWREAAIAAESVANRESGIRADVTIPWEERVAG